jgi:tetratricopeptide (TPR) repeat protein
MELTPALKKIDQKLKEMSPNYKFSRGVDRDIIETYEKAFDIIFSESYKQFLEYFDGGLIQEFHDSYYIDMTEFEPDSPKWSSYWLYSLEELIEKYRELTVDRWFIKETLKGTYPVIPIGRTPGPYHNTIFMFSTKGLEKESPVFVRFENKNISSCIEIAKDFNGFMEWYVASDGFPSISKIVNATSCNSFIKKNDIIEIAQKEIPEKEVIEQKTARIQLFPDDEWSYCERGNSYLRDGQVQNALDDFNKAIELNEKKAFFYYCRGELTLEYGSQRKALIDLDIAVNLDPDDHFYRVRRADAFYSLGKIKKALADCNTILNKDPLYEMALDIRYRIYRDLGEEEKAKADKDLLDKMED